MALDRFVHFEANGPTKDDLKVFLEDFFNGAATIEETEDRFSIDLPGNSSFPFKRLIDKPVEYSREYRNIEIYFSATLDVITRQADEYTNVIAAGLAKAIARFWKGTVEDN